MTAEHFDICRLCSSAEFCKQQQSKPREFICKTFVARYNCNACSLQCGDEVLCYRFIPKEVVLDSDKSHPVEAVLWDMLAELMKIEKSTDSVITKFKQTLEANGIKAVFADRAFRNYINNLLAIQTLDKLIQAYSLEEFREQILRNEIDRVFKPTPTVPETSEKK